MTDEAIEPPLDSDADIIPLDDFELQQSHLDSEQVTRLIADTIQTLPVDGTKVIALIGGPASGKSTMVQSLIDRVQAQGLKADSLSTDDYSIGTRDWRWQHERDNPLALKDFSLLNRLVKKIKQLKEGESVAVPAYDPQTGLAVAVGEDNFPHHVERVDVLFVEGDFEGVEAPDMTIFIDMPMEARMQTRIDRDLRTRGEADATKVQASFLSRHEKQYIPHTAPAAYKADLLLRVDPQPQAWQYDVYHAKAG